MEGRILHAGSTELTRIPLSRIAGALLVLLGVTVMLSWGLKLAAPVRIFPGFAPMVFNTALSFALAGAVLLFSEPARRRFVASLLGGALGVLSASVLAEHAFDVDLRIDWPQLHAWFRDENPKPGRMAAVNAFAFLAGAGAMILAPRATRRRVGTAARALALGIGTIGILGLAGHLVSARLLFPAYWFAGMALHTAAGLIVLAAGLWSSWDAFEWSRAPLFAREEDRITFIGAAVLVAMVLGAGTATFAILQGRVQDMAADNIFASLTRRVETFRDLIDLREGSARIAATRPAVIGNLRAIRAGRDDGANLANVRAVVESFVKQGFSGVAYHDLDGRLIAAGGEFVRESAIVVPLATPDKAVLLWNAGFVLRHRLPLRDAAGIAGTVIAEQPLPVLTRLARNPVRIGATGETGLCASHADRLLCFPNQLNRQVYSTALAAADGTPLPMARAVRGDTGVLITRDYRGANVVAAFAPVGDLGLGMVVKIDAAEILGPVREQMMVALGVLLVLAAAGAFLLRLALRPRAARLVHAEEQARLETGRAQLALGEREAGLHRAQLMAKLAHVITGPQGEFENWSHTLPSLIGIDPQQMPRSTREWLVLIHPEDRERFRAKSIEAAVTSGRAEIEYRLRRADGTWLYLHQFMEPLAGEAGAARWFCTIQDISERKGVEERLAALAARLVTLQEKERRDIARELHDRVGQNLTALDFNLEKLRGATISAAAARRTVEDSKALLTATGEAVSNVLTELKPPMLASYGLLDALRFSARDFSRRTAIAVDVAGDEAAPRLPPDIEMALFRVAQAALNNIARHAQAKKAAISLSVDGARLRFEIRDDGIGFDAAQALASGRWGLTAMKERAEAIGGTLRIASAPGAGARIVLEAVLDR